MQIKYVALSIYLTASAGSFAQDLSISAMAQVDGGSFEMGSNSGESNEMPPHKVTLNSFAIAKYETTQNLWHQVIGDDPSGNKGCAECPVESVTPAQVDSFISKLNRLTGLHYRLPTEAEWEYAAMGGKESKGYKYPGSNDLNEVAWQKTNSGGKTHPVGQRKPNELGIYDMAGNAWELCNDYYDPKYYKDSPDPNPRNDCKATFRVVRGGSWRSEENRCYSKARNRNVYDHYHYANGGFRLVLDK